MKTVMVENIDSNKLSLRAGRYQIIKKLGRGGFGITYLARDNCSDKSHYVIKQLDTRTADINTARRLFQREAETLQQLKQADHIPEFFDYFEEGEQYYIVEEYIEGQPLDRLTQEPWNQYKIIIFLWEMLSVLEVLQHKNLIHRDIKPSNIILREKDNKFVLIDFGAVKQIDTERQGQGNETLIYNPGYAPPEQMEGKPALNSDIYALGITAIELLTKITPQYLVRNPNGDINLDREVNASSALITILNKMVKTNWQERYQLAEEVLKAIQNIENIEKKPAAMQTTLVSSANSKQKITKGFLVGVVQSFLVSVQTTLVSSANVQQNQTQPKSKQKIKKSFLLPVVILGVGVLALEFIYPVIRPSFYNYQGDNLLDRHQPEIALGKFQTALDLQRNYVPAWIGRGNALFTLGRLSGALGAYKKALLLQPDNPKIRNNIGKILYQQGNYKEALQSYQQVLKLEPKNAEAFSGKGLAYIGLQQFEKAIESFDEAQKLKPDEPTVWLQKGLAVRYLQGSNAAHQFYEEALSIYNENAKKQSREPLTWVDKGFILLQLNRPSEALESYNRALSINKNFYEALVGKANALDILGKHEQALDLFDRATQIRPQEYLVWYNRGNLLQKVFKNHEEALKSFEKTIQLRPNFHPAWLNKGISLMALEREQDALVAFERATEINPKDPWGWANRGLVLEKLGENQEALNSYNKAVELDFAPAVEYRDNLKRKMGV